MSQQNSSLINYSKSRQATLILRALSHPSRQQLVELLIEEGPCKASYIRDQLGMDHVASTNLLHILSKSGVLESEVIEYSKYFKLNGKRLDSLLKTISIMKTY